MTCRLGLGHCVPDMSETFTKLFSSITRSSIWLEDDQTLRVWVTMLALADRSGYVGASVGGLAAMSRVPVEKTREALEKFLAPDPDSRSKEFEGRRIEVADRGWTLLNYERFRDMRDEEARKEYERKRKKDQRAKKRNVPDSPEMSRTVPACPKMSAVSAQAEAEAAQRKKGSSEPSSQDLKTDRVERAQARPRRRVATREELSAYKPGPGELEAIRRIGANPERLVEAWRNHHLAKGTEMVDIAASLRTWIAREPSFAPAPRSGKRPEAPGLTEHRRSGGRGDEGPARPEQAEWQPHRTGSPVRPSEALGLISNTLSSIGGTRE